LNADQLLVRKWTTDGSTWTMTPRSSFQPMLPAGTSPTGWQKVIALAAFKTRRGVRVYATTAAGFNQPNRLLTFLDDGSPTPPAPILARAPLNGSAPVSLFRGVAVAPLP